MRRIALNTVVVLAVLAGVYVVWQLRAAAVLFVLSLALAAALRPVIGWLVRRGLPRVLALGGSYLFVFGALGLILAAAAGSLVTDVQRFGDDFVLAYESVYDRSHGSGTEPPNSLALLPPPDDLFQALAGEQGAALLKPIIGATFTLFGMVVDLVIVVFLGVYWSIDQVRFERLWLSLLPVERRRAARELWQATEVEIGAYVRSEGVQSIAAGVLLWLGYRALGQPYPVLLALVGAVAWLIPWVGVLLAVGAVTFFSAPALVIDPRAALTSLLLSILYTSVVLLVLQRYVEPRFFDRRRYNALVTAIIIFGMADVAGLMGLVLGAPLAAALEIAGSHWMRLRLSAANEPARVASFEERLSAVRAALDGRQQAAPELVSLVDRLTALVEEADELLGSPSPGDDQSQISHLVADAPAS